MKLLIVTQIVDTEDPVLGFFSRWIEEFAKRTVRLEVICLKEGKHHFPKNVSIHSLGKERPPRFARRAIYAARFLKLAWRLRGNYDAVFVHMNPEYLVLAGWLWRLFGKPTALWYTHKRADIKLRIALLWANKVLTASKESFRMQSSKLQVMGHGVEFPVVTHQADQAQLRILTIGRVSRTKRINEMIAALDVLHEQGIVFSFTVVGAPVTTEDKAYEQSLQEARAQKPYKDAIRFIGPVPHRDLAIYWSRADVFVNLSATGSLDKAALEAVGAGIPLVTSNIALRELTPTALFVQDISPQTIAKALTQASNEDIGKYVVEVKEKHSLTSLIPRILISFS